MDELEKIWEETAKKAILLSSSLSSSSLSSSSAAAGSNKSKEYAMNEKDLSIDLALQCANCGREQSSTMSLKPELFFTCTLPQCGHMFCKRCLDNILLLRKTKFNCPRCNVLISESKLTEKSPDEIFSNLDTYNRRKIKEIFNKKEEDFPNDENGAEEYRRYDEMVEDIIFNLNNGIDVEETWAKINEYKNLHTSAILAISERNSYEKIEFERMLTEKEEEKKRKQLELERLDELESQRSKEEAKQRNGVMLGDKIQFKSMFDDSMTKKSQENIPEVQASIHPTQQDSMKEPNLAALFLFHRQPPKVIRGNQGNDKRQKLDPSLERAMHIAGGYDYIMYTKRNWQEIVNGIGWLQQDIDLHIQNTDRMEERVSTSMEIQVQSNFSNSNSSNNSDNSRRYRWLVPWM